MSRCEYSVPNISPHSIEGVGKMIVATSGGGDHCEVYIQEDPFNPVCDHKDLTTETCPIARWRDGKITLVEANVLLRAMLNNK